MEASDDSRSRRSTSAIPKLIPALREHPHIGWLLVRVGERTVRVRRRTSA
jgi:hypothetical protein